MDFFQSIILIARDCILYFVFFCLLLRDNLDTDIYGANLYNRYLSRLSRKQEVGQLRQRRKVVAKEKLPPVGTPSIGTKARAAAAAASARLAAVTSTFTAQAAFSSSLAARKLSSEPLFAGTHEWVDEPDSSAHLYGIDSWLAAYETRVDHLLADLEVSQTIEKGEAPARAARCTSILVRTGVHNDSNGDLDDQQSGLMCYENGLSSHRESGWKEQWAVARSTTADLTRSPLPRTALRHVHREFPDVPALRLPNLVVDHVADAVRRVFADEHFKAL